MTSSRDAGPPERWREAKAVLAEALDREPHQRQAFLDQACSGNPGLCAEVLSLLGLEEQMHGFLDEPAASLHELEPPDGNADRDSGRRIGPYRLKTQLGSGGMGTVFLAERGDQEFEHRVALKLLKPGLDSDEIVLRFQAERQILAFLEHPGIARLLDGGTTVDGLPYFVMEYVEGEPIDRFCAARGLSLNDRLGLFLRICEAVDYAHRNLVVHRDLKPANILVTDDGQPKLLDFGIAKILTSHHSGHTTAVVSRFMTPRYASPEQARGGAITTATDVFSLGVMLGELLSGSRPFGGEDPSPTRSGELRRRPRRPSTTNPSLHRDLDAIVLKAIADEPRSRYSSVASLAEDVTRFLNGQPVLARRQTTIYRMRKLLRRRYRELAAAVLVASLGVSLLVNLDQRRRAQRQRSQVEREYEHAKQLREFVVDLLTQTDARRAGERTFTASEVIDRAAASSSKYLADFPETQTTLLEAMAMAYSRQGRPDRSLELLEDALALGRRTFGPDDWRVAEVLSDRGASLLAQQQPRAAEEALREALRILDEGPDERPRILAATLDTLGMALWQQGDFRAAEEPLREALEIRRRALGNEPADMVLSLSNQALNLRYLGRSTEAEANYREGLAISRKVLGEDHPETASICQNLGVLLRDRGNLEEATPLIRRSLEIRRRIFERQDHPLIASSMISLGRSLQLEGLPDQAAALFREALAIERLRLGDEYPSLPTTMSFLALAVAAQGDPATGETLARQALDVAQRALPEGHWRAAVAESALGACLTELGRYDEAEPLLRSSLATLASSLGDEAIYSRESRERLERLEALRQGVSHQVVHSLPAQSDDG